MGAFMPRAILGISAYYHDSAAVLPVSYTHLTLPTN